MRRVRPPIAARVNTSRARAAAAPTFSDYRGYVPGDDVRFVDWNIFARTGRPYLKLYQHEEVLHVVILVDASSSMLFEDKLLRAKQLAAAFGVWDCWESKG